MAGCCGHDAKFDGVSADYKRRLWIVIALNAVMFAVEMTAGHMAKSQALQARFPERTSLCAYGAGTDRLHAPQVTWTGQSTYIQKTGINHDFGVFDSPDAFYKEHRQLTGLRGLLYRHVIRHWMNRRVARIRQGLVPTIPGGGENLLPKHAPINLKEAM